MNDPEIHSSTWEWDMVGLSSQWRSSHNTNTTCSPTSSAWMMTSASESCGSREIRNGGRATCSSRCARCCWLSPSNGAWPVRPVSSAGARPQSRQRCPKKALLRKMARQAGKDYVLFPALSRRRWRRDAGANVVANGLRNAWAYIVIVCGHFADGAEKFSRQFCRMRRNHSGICGRCWVPRIPGRPGAGLHDWKPLLPDRTSPLP